METAVEQMENLAEMAKGSRRTPKRPSTSRRKVTPRRPLTVRTRRPSAPKRRR